ncbi:hypothetical protein LR48_Vigan07g220700 [Vigna angularis]|uniref:Uncharacterized protein n=1 Tax=Phaseolus angularis TaxID=3914 RepID=A0A0L9V0G1_PHAAN|nr:hypothetical protein LR48_Vigan07g220700 [Vigna angularis]
MLGRCRWWEKKGRVYGARQLVANYATTRGGTRKHQPSSSTTTIDKAVVRLTQALEQCDQEYSYLRHEFTKFKQLIMRLMSKASQLQSTVPPTQLRLSPSPTISEQPTLV